MTTVLQIETADGKAVDYMTITNRYWEQIAFDMFHIEMLSHFHKNGEIQKFESRESMKALSDLKIVKAFVEKQRNLYSPLLDYLASNPSYKRVKCFDADKLFDESVRLPKERDIIALQKTAIDKTLPKDIKKLKHKFTMNIVQTHRKFLANETISSVEFEMLDWVPKDFAN